MKTGLFVVLFALMLLPISFSQSNTMSIYAVIECTSKDTGLPISQALFPNNVDGGIDLAKNSCKETIPDSVINKIKNPEGFCTYSAFAQLTNNSKPLDNGWYYNCKPHTSYENNYFFNLAFLAFIEISLFPIFLIATPILLLVFLFVYGIVTIYRKQKGLNYYILPIFYGIIGGIIAAFANKKEMKYHIIIGIVTTIIMILF